MRKCPCGSGRKSWWENAARGIPLARICPECRDKTLAKYRPDVLTNPQYETDEPIEEETMRYICGNSFQGVVSQPCVIPETLGEAADLERTTISYLCLAAVYQLLEEGKLTITDVQAAYQRGESSS